MSDPSISRRESLKRAAGALALGLGAPAALAATAPVSSNKGISFCKGKLGRPLFKMEIPDEVAAMLQEPEAFNYIKFDGVDGESRATWFEVRRARG